MIVRKLTLFVLFLALLHTNAAKSQNKEIQAMLRQQLDTSTTFSENRYQEVSNEQIMSLFEAQPSFSMFHDNYVSTGIPTNKEINKSTADVKFQISIRQRLMKSKFLFNSALFLTYTQKSFWDIYQNSAPFADNNYNPGLTLARPIVYNDQLKGAGAISLEHESNGLDSIHSRSWNFISISGVYFYNNNLSVQAKVWTGILGKGSKDLFRYRGHGSLTLNYRNNKDDVWLSLVLNPTGRLRGVNTIVEFNYRPGKKANQYLFLQWYNGYGESLLNYNEYSSMVRVGICIKPAMRNFY